MRSLVWWHWICSWSEMRLYLTCLDRRDKIDRERAGFKGAVGVVLGVDLDLVHSCLSVYLSLVTSLLRVLN